MESEAVKRVPPRAGASTSEPAVGADADAGQASWEGLEETAEFKRLVAARWRFVLPATVLFLAYYFALPVLNGVAPEFMRTKVFGNINIAYLFALSEFFMAWLLAFLYIRRASAVFDPLAEAVRRRAARGPKDAAR